MNCAGTPDHAVHKLRQDVRINPVFNFIEQDQTDRRWKFWGCAKRYERRKPSLK